MKKFIILYFVLSIFTCFIYSQPASQITNDNIPFSNENIGLLGAQCIGGLVYDDNTWENGYGWNPGYGIGKYVLKMTPTSYPFTVNQVCLALTRTAAGSANFTFDICMYDETGTGGGPGTLLGSILNQTAANVPTWPTVSWFDFTGITTLPQVTSGSFYIGLSWDPATMGSHYIGADESPTTTLRQGYGYIQSAWNTIQSFYANYKCIGVRCDGAGQTYTHNIAVGPFLSFPPMFYQNWGRVIKAKVKNMGTSNEIGIPIKFFVNGTQINSLTINLNAGQTDSVSFNWTPTDTGIKNVRIVSVLATDQYRANDTVKANVMVYPPSPPNYCVGTDSVSIGYPFYTYYMDSRTDMMYTPADIGTNSGTVLGLRFYVLSVGPQVMNGFKIKMQNTTLTSLTGFVSTGWTEVYSANYVIPGTGLIDIQLQTPFPYNGYGKNLLIEICFNNSSWTANTMIKGHPATGKVFHNHQDLTSGDGCVEITTGSLQTIRPNMCLYMMGGGIKNIESELPDEFSLSQNYPNPFNPMTTIQYQIPLSSGVPEGRGVLVKLTIFDALGREVAVLINERKSAGSYRVEWDGSKYASGLYFYKLSAGDFTDVKKMVLIK